MCYRFSGIHPEIKNQIIYRAYQLKKHRYFKDESIQDLMQMLFVELWPEIESYDPNIHNPDDFPSFLKA